MIQYHVEFSKCVIFLPSKGTREQYLRLCVQSSKVSVDKQLYNQIYKSTMCYYSWHEVKVNVVLVLIWGKINIKIKRCLLKYFEHDMINYFLRIDIEKYCKLIMTIRCMQNSFVSNWIKRLPWKPIHDNLSITKRVNVGTIKVLLSILYISNMH